MVGAACPQLGGDVRSLARGQLRRVDPELVSDRLRPAEQGTRLGGRECRGLAPDIEEDRPRLERGQHLVHDRANIGVASDAGGNDVSPEERRDHPKWAPRCELAQHVERLRLVVDIESVSGLGLDRCCAVREEAVGARLRQIEQGRAIGLPGRPDGTGNPTIARLLRPVGDAAHPLRELVGTRAGKDRVGVGIDQTRDDAGAGRIEQVAVERNL